MANQTPWCEKQVDCELVQESTWARPGASHPRWIYQIEGSVDVCRY